VDNSKRQAKGKMGKKTVKTPIFKWFETPIALKLAMLGIIDTDVSEIKYPGLKMSIPRLNISL